MGLKKLISGDLVDKNAFEHTFQKNLNWIHSVWVLLIILIYNRQFIYIDTTNFIKNSLFV